MKIHLLHHYIFIFLLLCCYCVFFAVGARAVWCPSQLVRRRLLGSHPLDLPSKNLLLSTDASALLAFKSKADLGNKLDFSSRTSLAFCKWQGVECSQAKVVRFVVENLNLSGIFASDTLNRLDQLRVLSLQNNSLTGPIPDLSGLANLKVLFLDHNYFSGSVPPSISTLHRLKTLDLSYNSLTGLIPVSLNNLDRLYYLRLDFNRCNGSVPPLNQSMLQIFNVSHNNLSGPIPITQTLSRFKTASFLNNPGLCGEIIHKECNTIQPFFGPPTPAVTPPPKPAVLGQNAQSQHQLELNHTRRNDHKRTALIIGLSSSMFILIGSLLCFALISRKFNKHSQDSKASTPRMVFNTAAATADAEAVMRIEEDNYELEEKVKRVQEGMHAMGRSGSLVFCAGEAHVYTLEQLMRASAELLGRGTMGTTYKAVLDSRLIVCVKRLDAGRFAGASNDVFDQHMGSVGGLRHPNLVPLRAYFQAKEERLLVYDYQPNGSLFSLIHGSKSTRSKPLHWTSCLKIAEDVAQGLSYIHQAWRLVHGNLKSSNVLLGSDFEACVTDYCLPAIASGASIDEDPDATSYKAPEIRKFNTQQATSKSDVYAFGILLLELLTGKHPSQHPYLMPDDMVNWVRLTRDEDSGEDNRFEMLLEVAMTCSVASPEQRPTMWQVLKMIQEIKEAVIVEDS